MIHNRMFARLCRVLVVALALAGAIGGQAEAAPVSQLDILSGSVAAKFDGLPYLPAIDFTQNGTMVMGTFQPPPDILPPINFTIPLVGSFSLSLITQANPGGLPAQYGTVTGSILSVDLQSLFANLTGPSSVLPGGSLQLNIGNQSPLFATGTFDSGTNEFTLGWEHLFTGPKGHTIAGLKFTLAGTAQTQVAPVPLPAAVMLFGSGIAGLLAAKARRLFV